MTRKSSILILTVALSATAAVPAARSQRSSDLDLYRRGRGIFVSLCTPCHGRTGRGDGPWAEGMRPAPRDLRLGVFKYRSTPVGTMPTDEDLRRTITRGISGTGMPTFKDRLPPRDINAIIVYIKSLSPRWRDSANLAEPANLPKPPEWMTPGRPLHKEAITHGRKLFDQTCATCHGTAGKGDGTGAAGLKDAWGNPAAPADLTQPHLRSGDNPEDVYRTIRMGLDGTPMAGFGEALADEQIWQLVAFVRSLPGQPTP